MTTQGQEVMKPIAIGLAISIALTGCSSSHKKATPTPSASPVALPTFGPGASYHPVINPADFGPNITNPWLPFTPGTTMIYTGTKDGQPSRDVFTITTAARVIDGVRCRVVHDSLFLSGKLEEKTIDYYAQDKAGNVWYFGEDTEELDERGKVTSREGSWLAGVHGAEPGVFMEADPVVGHRFRQEYYKGHAEDQYTIVDLDASVTVPYRSFTHALRTEETTSLEPGTLDNKYYVRGVGEVEEITVKGPLEKAVLVQITRA